MKKLTRQLALLGLIAVLFGCFNLSMYFLLTGRLSNNFSGTAQAGMIDVGSYLPHEESSDLARIDADTFRQASKIPLTIVLDNVRSLHNVGSVLRTADAFRLRGVYMCGITAVPPSPEIHKTALGAEDSVAWRYFDDTLTAVRQLQSEGVSVWAVEQVEQSVMLPHFRFSSTQAYALVLGHEVKGVRQDVVDACNGAIEIPQFGTKHSLNVSVTAGIVMWEAARQLMPLIEGFEPR